MLYNRRSIESSVVINVSGFGFVQNYTEAEFTNGDQREHNSNRKTGLRGANDVHITNIRAGKLNKENNEKKYKYLIVSTVLLRKFSKLHFLLVNILSRVVSRVK